MYLLKTYIMVLQGNWHCKRMLFVESVKVKKKKGVVSNPSYSKFFGFFFVVFKEHWQGGGLGIKCVWGGGGLFFSPAPPKSARVFYSYLCLSIVV